MRDLITIVENATTEMRERFNRMIAKTQRETGCMIDAECWPEWNSIDLDMIQRGSEKGSGAKAMHAILAFADKYGMEVKLMVGDANPKLAAYYRQFGFKIEGIPDDQQNEWLANHAAEWNPSDFTPNDSIPMVRPSASR
jgi:hypothetical protein